MPLSIAIYLLAVHVSRGELSPKVQHEVFYHFWVYRDLKSFTVIIDVFFVLLYSGGAFVKFVWATIGRKILNDCISAKEESIEL